MSDGITTLQSPVRPNSSGFAVNAWEVLTESLRAAARPQAILLALVGVLTIHASVLATRRLSRESVETPAAKQVVTRDVQVLLQQVGIREVGRIPADPVIGVPRELMSPVLSLFAVSGDVPFLRRLLRSGLELLVWSFFGVAIVRMAILRCGLQRDLRLRESLEFAANQAPHVIGAPVTVLLAIFFMGLPIYFVSWLLRFDVGSFVLSLMWIGVLFFAAISAALGVGLACSWPLMWGAIATEDSDLFDAISRAYAYAFQRPVSYVWHLVVAALLAMAAWGLAWLTSLTVVELTYWIVQVGAGPERVELLKRVVADPTSFPDVAPWFGRAAALVAATNQLPSMLVEAYAHSLFWSLTGGVYLLQRLAVDDTAIDDIVGTRHALGASQDTSVAP